MSPFIKVRQCVVTYAFAILVAVATAAAARDAQALRVGDPAPAFQASALTGGAPIALEQHRGKVVYLDFWASWCPPCLTSLPLLEQLREEFAPEDFQILAVNLDKDAAKARRFLERIGVGYPSAHDPLGALPEVYDVQTMPTSFLIDRRGNIQWIHGGFRRSDLPALRDRIRAMIGGGH